MVLTYLTKRETLEATQSRFRYSH